MMFRRESRNEGIIIGWPVVSDRGADFAVQAIPPENLLTLKMARVYY